jgi:hypothetical protein
MPLVPSLGRKNQRLFGRIDTIGAGCRAATDSTAVDGAHRTYGLKPGFDGPNEDWHNQNKSHDPAIAKNGAITGPI